MTNTDKNEDVKELLIKKILAKGLPVVSCVDFADSSATVWVKTDGFIMTDDYGAEFLESGVGYDEGKSLNDITDLGLLNLVKYGVRPGEEDYKNYVEYCDPNSGDDDG
jgi:hypothetical protein